MNDDWYNILNVSIILESCGVVLFVLHAILTPHIIVISHIQKQRLVV